MPDRHRLPADLRTLILRCLEKDPARRLPGAEFLALEQRRVGAPVGIGLHALQETPRLSVEQEQFHRDPGAGTAVRGIQNVSRKFSHYGSPKSFASRPRAI